MSNLLSAELYKLKNDFTFRLMAVLAVIFTFAQYGINAIMEGVLRRGEASGVDAEVQAELLEGLEETSILEILHNMFANTNAIIFATIFVCCFVIADYRSGMVVNFVGKGYKRTEVFLAKFFAAQLGAALLYLLTALTTLLIGLFFCGTEGLNAGFFYDYIKFVILHILFLTAYNAVIILVCTLTRAMASGILVSVFGVMTFSVFIVQGIDLILSYFDVEAGVSQYWIVTIISSCPARDIPSHFLAVSGTAAAFWLVISTAAGLFFFGKRDVR